MTDPKEFNSLDELFRKTFDDLPDTPAPSGWDTPSPQVWDEVRVRLKPPRSGWSTQALMLVSGLAVVLLLGLYWVLSRPEKPVEEIPQTTGQPAATVETPAAQPETANIPAQEKVERAVAPAITTTAPAPALQRTTNEETRSPESPAHQPAPNTTERQTEEHPGRARPTGSAPLPGSSPVSPNTTVRRQAEAWRSAPWAKPLAPLPTILEMPVIRPVPEGLKELGKGGI